MKQLPLLAVCCVILIGLGGCQKAGKRGEKIVKGNGQFPETMVGVWEAEEGPSKWVFKFERDGSILEMTHSVAGEVDLREGAVYVEGTDEGTYADFIMGPCEAKYDADTGELRVEIILDYYHMVLPQGEVEGKVHDYIKGLVSEDGKTWQAQWVNYLWMEGASPPDPNLVEANPVPLVFVKVGSE